MNEIKSLKEIVETLLECNYECEAGPLKNNKDFRLLAKMAGVELPKSVGEGIVDLKKSVENVAQSVANILSYKSDQRRRDEIVEQAKQDIKKIERVGRSYLTPGDTGNYTYRHRVFYVEFVVNRKKRTVVALVRDARTGEVCERGKAKCAPQDCFNSHIGKAIALRRALNLEVPDEYLNAPQPTEVRVGDVVESYSFKQPKKYVVVGTDKEVDEKDDCCHVSSIIATSFPYRTRIIDDSREGVAE